MDIGSANVRLHVGTSPNRTETHLQQTSHRQTQLDTSNAYHKQRQNMVLQQKRLQISRPRPTKMSPHDRVYLRNFVIDAAGNMHNKCDPTPASWQMPLAADNGHRHPPRMTWAYKMGPQHDRNIAHHSNAWCNVTMAHPQM